MSGALAAPAQTPLRRAWEVLAALGAGEIREDRGFTVTGILKWIIEPVLFMAAYYVLVRVVLTRGSQLYPLFILCALLPFRFFTGVVGASMTIVQSHSSILTNRSFPRVVLPLVLLGSEGFAFGISLLLLGAVMGLSGIVPTLQLLWVPVIVAVLAVVTGGLAYIGTVFGLYFPDFRGLVTNLLRVSFFLSTGLVRAGEIGGDRLPDLLQANPLSGIFDAMRSVVMRGRPPDPLHLLYPLAVGLVLLGIGLALYLWRQDQFAKEV